MIYLGADHRGFLLKDKIKIYLDSQAIPYQDLGPAVYDQDDDYPQISIKIGETIAHTPRSQGILICGSGVGAAIAANKVIGIRAGLCFSPQQTAAARHDDDINLLCLSASAVSESENLELVKIFLETPFSSSERYLRRLRQIRDYESQKCH